VLGDKGLGYRNDIRCLLFSIGGGCFFRTLQFSIAALLSLILVLDEGCFIWEIYRCRDQVSCLWCG